MGAINLEPGRRQMGFVMRVSEDDDDSDREEEMVDDRELVTTGSRRFTFTNCSESDSSGDDDDDDLVIEEYQLVQLMGRVGLLDGALAELENERHQGITDRVRNEVRTLEIDLMHVYERSASALGQVEKVRECRREEDGKIDMRHCRTIAEHREEHLLTVQRDHEHRWKIALEEARRKEQAYHEEKKRQEKAKAETEAAEKRAEEARIAAEANRLAKEAAEREDVENAKRASEEAQKLKEVNDKRELQIGRRIRQISGTRDCVIEKASELIELLKDPQYPQSISAAMFAKQVVSQCLTQRANFNSTAFACGHVIVLVTSQVPLAMDLLLAEFHKACIYTLPEHVVYSELAISIQDYFTMMGYPEKDGTAESPESSLERVASYMKLYGALVQTEVSGVQNLHGLKEGWACVARLLNSLPTNLFTEVNQNRLMEMAVALNSFLEMAGFALFRTYKNQFRKLLNYISRHFLDPLESRKDPELNAIVVKLKTYIDTNQFLKEPEGWLLKSELLSEYGC
ncbi:hypothetical protein MKW94_003869 [Papaver nudicaule]|uniref:mRNA export factor GLE1 n=1 Tax=Papaver nudicaule TaxID=74823 RepID=A0AA41S6F8_PAPNU|nr:hypothetical protein [Papaver nudicaule]